MSNAYPITAPRLASAEQALSQALADSKVILAYYAGSRYEASVTIVIDVITTAITLVGDAKRRDLCSPHLIETVTELAKRFAKLSPHRRRLAIELVMELIRSGLRGVDSAQADTGNP